MAATTTVAKHSALQSLLLHLVPGLLIGVGYFVLVGPLQRVGYPSMMALMVSAALVLVPVELGTLLYLGRQRNGKLSLAGVVLYRNAIPVGQYALWVPVVFIVVGIVFTLFKPVDAFLQANVFSAWPVMDAGLTSQYSRQALILTYAMVGVFGTVAGPIVEELYFRGFLLPRMDYAGRWAPLLHSFLFALYHIFTPWMLVTRTVGMLPIAYAARRKNLYIGMIVHVLVNAIDLIAGIAFIAAVT